MNAENFIPHSRPFLGDSEQVALAGVIASGRLAQGPRVELFERSLAAFVGVEGGVAVGSGTAALEVALLALGVESGDEVIMPSFVCAAPLVAARRIGAVPRIVDIEPDTYAIDPVAAKQAVSPRTGAIVVPHLFGLPADMSRLIEIGVPIIEDCAQTLGAAQEGQAVGTRGIATICSFYATKLLCTGEGGMILSDDEDLLSRARSMREYDEQPSIDAGSFNHKMTDLQAVLGLSQMERLPSFLERRGAIARRYAEALGAHQPQSPVIPDDRTHVFYRYVIRVDRPLDDLIERLGQDGVDCRRPIFRPLHQYLHLSGFPETERAFQTALSIPIYPALTPQEIEHIVKVLEEEFR